MLYLTQWKLKSTLSVTVKGLVHFQNCRPQDLRHSQTLESTKPHPPDTLVHSTPHTRATANKPRTISGMMAPQRGSAHTGRHAAWSLRNLNWKKPGRVQISKQRAWRLESSTKAMRKQQPCGKRGCRKQGSSKTWGRDRIPESPWWQDQSVLAIKHKRTLIMCDTGVNTPRLILFGCPPRNI